VYGNGSVQYFYSTCQRLPAMPSSGKGFRDACSGKGCLHEVELSFNVSRELDIDADVVTE
jgi:hypothetical protein